ncbi:MAG: hypothetical protein Q4Q23_07925, partial [Methanobacteriaceae archaeon]|nr:hypothetical protein [Methanobacteriaceae archaeon]
TPEMTTKEIREKKKEIKQNLIAPVEKKQKNFDVKKVDNVEGIRDNVVDVKSVDVVKDDIYNLSKRQVELILDLQFNCISKYLSNYPKSKQDKLMNEFIEIREILEHVSSK